MKKCLVILVLLANLVSLANAEDNVKIGKQNIKLTSDLMTPEALWAMGRIGSTEASKTHSLCGPCGAGGLQGPCQRGPLQTGLRICNPSR